MTDNEINKTNVNFRQLLTTNDINPAIKKIEYATDVFIKEAELNQELKNI